MFTIQSITKTGDKKMKTTKANAKTGMRITALMFLLSAVFMTLDGQKAATFYTGYSHTTTFRELLNDITSSVNHVQSYDHSVAAVALTLPVLESEMKTEDWMMNPATWYCLAENNTEVIDPAETKDPELRIEGWMLDEDYFAGNTSYMNNDKVVEEKLVIEDWMLDQAHFSKTLNELDNSTSADEPLKVEDWMLDQNHWIPGDK